MSWFLFGAKITQRRFDGNTVSFPLEEVPLCSILHFYIVHFFSTRPTAFATNGGQDGRRTRQDVSFAHARKLALLAGLIMQVCEYAPPYFFLMQWPRSWFCGGPFGLHRSAHKGLEQNQDCGHVAVPRCFVSRLFCGVSTIFQNAFAFLINLFIDSFVRFFCAANAQNKRRAEAFRIKNRA